MNHEQKAKHLEKFADAEQQYISDFIRVENKETF